MHTVLLLLGGNIGEVKENFAQAIAKLSDYGRIKSVSGLYRTHAWRMDDAPDFLNQALLLETGLAPRKLLVITAGIEDEAGRKRGGSKNGYRSRELDIDILLVDEEIIDTPELLVPHPRMHERKFTLVPAAEIAGHWQHPVLKKDLDTLNNECTDSLPVEAL